MAKLTTNEIQELINLVSDYDCYIEYIDDYHQYKQAEHANEHIKTRFIEICSGFGLEVTTSDFNKVLWQSHYTSIEEAVNNLVNTNEEETAMTTTSNNEVPMIPGLTKAERMMNMLDILNNVIKTSDERYITKEALAIFLFDQDIIGHHLSKSELKKIKRQELVDILSTAVNNLIKAGVIKPLKTVPVEELINQVKEVQGDVLKDNSEEINHAKINTVNNDAKAKTDKLLGLLKEKAAYNEKNNYGYTISSFMLQAVILEAGTGLTKFKGHKMTEEDLVITKRVYKWLMDMKYIKPVVYSVKEDANVRVYMPEYNGRTTSDKTKLIPYAKSNGYTAHQVTSFMVTLR